MSLVMAQAAIVGRVGAVFPSSVIGGGQFGKTIASDGGVFPGLPWMPTSTVSAYRKLPDAPVIGVTIASIPAAPAVGIGYTTESSVGAFVLFSATSFWAADATDGRIIVDREPGLSERPDPVITGA